MICLTLGVYDSGLEGEYIGLCTNSVSSDMIIMDWVSLTVGEFCLALEEVNLGLDGDFQLGLVGLRNMNQQGVIMRVHQLRTNKQGSSLFVISVCIRARIRTTHGEMPDPF